MRKWLMILALALSLAGASTASVAAQPEPDPCVASEHGLTTAGNESGEAPSGGVFHGKEQSNEEASQMNFCDQP